MKQVIDAFPGNEQAKRWNGVAGQSWAEIQDLIDHIFKPFEDLLVDAVSASRSSSVLDVGCGNGGITIALAKTLGSNALCLGVDISEPMLAAARARADRESSTARFQLADAQTYDFEPDRFDHIVSRFGVMFFDDPVAAFGNLRRAATDQGQLQVVTWREPDENPFMKAAVRAARPFLPNIPPYEPNAPGQFGLADAERTRQILEKSGWVDIDLQPLDIACSFPTTELETYFTRLGPLSLVLQEADESTRQQVIEAVRAAFEPYVDGSEVRFTAGCWMVCARNRG